MLVLSRRESEQIVIDGRITVSVVKVKGKVVRLGIEAPKGVPILRGELGAGKKVVAACASGLAKGRAW